MKKEYKCVQFDFDANTMELLNGTVGIYNLDDIDKCSVMNEEAKFKGKSKPFSHQVLGGTTFFTTLGEPRIYVGLKITLKNGDILAIYTSENPTGINTDQYHKDRALAQKIETIIKEKVA